MNVIYRLGGKEKKYTVKDRRRRLEPDVELQGLSGSGNDTENETVRHGVAFVEEDEAIE